MLKLNEDNERGITKDELDSFKSWDVQYIPEWAIPYIDMTTMVNNILAPFIPVLKIFKFKTLEEGKTRNGVDRKTEGLSRMVKF